MFMNDFKWSLAEIENMFPFERDIYTFMLIESIEKRNKEETA